MPCASSVPVSLHTSRVGNSGLDVVRHVFLRHLQVLWPPLAVTGDPTESETVATVVVVVAYGRC